MKPPIPARTTPLKGLRLQYISRPVQACIFIILLNDIYPYEIVALVDVGCFGNESGLAECSRAPWGKSYACPHDHDVGVACYRNGKIYHINVSVLLWSFL